MDSYTFYVLRFCKRHSDSFVGIDRSTGPYASGGYYYETNFHLAEKFVTEKAAREYAASSPGKFQVVRVQVTLDNLT